jgi:hypothetical protein
MSLDWYTAPLLTISAAKYEENHGRVPNLRSLCYNCCNSYCEKEFIMMETMILKKLQFRLGAPTAETFLQMFFKVSFTPQTPQITCLARYIIDQSLIHTRFVGVLPSTIAYSAIHLAQQLLHTRNVPKQNQIVQACMSNLNECLARSPPQLVKKVSYDTLLIIVL